MHAFKLLAILGGISAILGLSGCTGPVVVAPGNPLDVIPPGHDDSLPNEDGRLCGLEPARGPVYIQIGYDASGMPVVNPDRCMVHSETTVTWRGPGNQQVAFEIEFKSRSAGEHSRIASARARERDKAMIVATSGFGRYAYSIKANGKELDPEIIIDPR